MLTIQESISPQSLDNRYIFEDVSNTLVPCHYLADVAGIHMPVMNSIIAISSVLLNNDFLRKGRTLQKLGFHSMTRQEIMERMHS